GGSVGRRKAPLWLVGLDMEQLARRLLLEPLARVTLVDAGGLGQLERGQRPLVRQRPVEAELVSQVNREQIESADRIHEEPPDKLVAAGRFLSHTHLLSPPWVSPIFACSGTRGQSGHAPSAAGGRRAAPVAVARQPATSP